MILKWPESMIIEPLKCAWDLWLDVWSIFTDGLCVLGYNVLYMFLRTSLLSMLHKSSACSLLSGLLHPSITKKDVLKSSEGRFVNIFSLFWQIVLYIFQHCLLLSVNKNSVCDFLVNWTITIQCFLLFVLYSRSCTVFFQVFPWQICSFTFKLSVLLCSTFSTCKWHISRFCCLYI